MCNLGFMIFFNRSPTDRLLCFIGFLLRLYSSFFIFFTHLNNPKKEKKRALIKSEYNNNEFLLHKTRKKEKRTKKITIIEKETYINYYI